MSLFSLFGRLHPEEFAVQKESGGKPKEKKAPKAKPAKH